MLSFPASAGRRPAAKSVKEAIETVVEPSQQFTCNICFATLQSRDALNRHRQIHPKTWWPSTEYSGKGNNSNLNSPPQPFRQSEMRPQNLCSNLDRANISQATSGNFRNSSQFSKPVFTTPQKSLAPSKFATSTKHTNVQNETPSGALDLCIEKPRGFSEKDLPKSQQKLISCTFCFLPLETPKMLQTHLAKEHSFTGTASQNSNKSITSPNNCVKLEPGTSPPDEKNARNQKYKCNKCPFRNYYAEVKQHQKDVHSECEFMCDYILCTYVFTTAQGLRKHMLKSHGEKNPFVCEICEQIFYLRETLNDHICGKSPISKGKSRVCPYKCGYRAHTEWDIKRPSSDHCVLNPGRTIKCRQCKINVKQFDLPEHKEEFHSDQLVNTRRKLRERDSTGKVI